MTALAEALTAAQRRAIAGIEKAAVAGAMTEDEVRDALNEIGATDRVEQDYLIACLKTIAYHGGQAPAELTNGTPPDKPASDKQRVFIARLCDERGYPAPDLAGVTSVQASEIIGQLQNGTYEKSKQLLRSKPKYRRTVASAKRTVASAKRWQKIVAEKQGPCRACTAPGRNGHDLGRITFHHVVSREDFGDDVADNIVPLHEVCHANVTQRRGKACANLLTSLTDAEYSYMIERGGEGYAERAYGLVYSR